MDLTVANRHLLNATNIMGEKSRESGFDQSKTAAGQLCIALASLLKELGKEPHNYPVEDDGFTGILSEVTQEPGVYSGRINPTAGGTSPFRHRDS